ncbi:MAG: protein kinase [Opitutales bacterium]|nr:protein kinase [Opitutales bacterium]
MDDDKTVLGDSGDESDSLESGFMLGDYRISRLLGRGAMGEVYEAEQVHLGRSYAVKVLPGQLTEDPRFRERFRTEARTLASLSHANVVSVMYAGEADGRFFLVMELLNAFAQPQGPEAIQASLVQVLSGLAYAHGKGIVHRDLKPSNLLQTSDGVVKVADFGVAQVVGEAFVKSVVEESIARSQVGDVATIADGSGKSCSSFDYAGTLQYMAPEVMQGGEATVRSDLYAVGVMAYEWLTGRKPVGRYKDASKWVEGLDPAWDDWINAVLEPEPEDRIASAELALEQLQGIGLEKPREETQSTPVAAHPVKSSGKGGRWLVLLLLLFVAGGALGYYYGVHLPAEQEREREAQALAEAKQVAAEAQQMRERIESLPMDAPADVLAELQSAVGAYLDNAPDEFSDTIAADWRNAAAELEAYRLEHARGSVRVVTRPEAAVVVINDVEEQTSPATFDDLRLGVFSVHVSKDGYEAWEGEVEVVEDGLTEVSVELERSKGELALALRGELQSGQFSLYEQGSDDEAVAAGSMPFRGTIPVGLYTYKVWHDSLWGPINAEGRVEVLRAEAAELSVELPVAKLTIGSIPEGAEIRINDQVVGTAPMLVTGLPKETRLTVDLHKEGYRTARNIFLLTEYSPITGWTGRLVPDYKMPNFADGPRRFRVLGTTRNRFSQAFSTAWETNPGDVVESTTTMGSLFVVDGLNAGGFWERARIHIESRESSQELSPEALAVAPQVGETIAIERQPNGEWKGRFEGRNEDARVFSPIAPVLWFGPEYWNAEAIQAGESWQVQVPSSFRIFGVSIDSATGSIEGRMQRLEDGSDEVRFEFDVRGRFLAAERQRHRDNLDGHAFEDAIHFAGSSRLLVDESATYIEEGTIEGVLTNSIEFDQQLFKAIHEFEIHSQVEPVIE